MNLYDKPAIDKLVELTDTEIRDYMRAMPQAIMMVEVLILDTNTGEMADFSTKWYDPEAEDALDNLIFLWSEGNYSCDCNRALFYGRARGVSEEDLEELSQCGDGRYKVLSIKRPSGEVLYSE